MDRLRAYLFDHVFGAFRIRDKPFTQNMSILFANQPFNGGPGAARSFASYSLYMSRLAYILRPKGNKPSLRKNFHMIVVPFSAAAWFLSLLGGHRVTSLFRYWNVV
jgi:hypothetical protein